MTPFLLFALVSIACHESMDSNYFRKWLHSLGPWFTNNQSDIQYIDPYRPKTYRNRKWWAKIGGGAFMTFWHTCKTILLLFTYTWAGIMSGLPVWAGFATWIVHGVVHEVWFRRVNPD